MDRSMIRNASKGIDPKRIENIKYLEHKLLRWRGAKQQARQISLSKYRHGVAQDWFDKYSNKQKLGRIGPGNEGGLS